MERNFTDENFENFLQQRAEHFRMPPSDKVWKSLSRELNRKKRRFTLAAGSFMAAASLLGYLFADFSSRKPETATEPLQQEAAGRAPATGLTPVQPETPATQTPVVAMKEYPRSTAARTAMVARTPAETASEPAGKADPASPLFERNMADRRIDHISLISALPAPEARTGLTAEEAISPVTVPEAASFTPTVVDSDQPPSEEATDLKVEEVTAAAEGLPGIESVVNAYASGRARKGRRADVQVFFTPTVSYRKLSENKDFLNSAVNQPGTQFPYLYNVNNIVTHKPDIGFEFGFAVRKPLSNSLKVRAGLQFNINRYDIKAFNSTNEVATIALSNGNRIDSLSTITNYRNLSGYRTDWLQNYYFQVSVPVGLELKLGGNSRTSFGMASSIQPTYLIGDRAYLISSDYKNYAEVPWLIRRWNLNTNLEAFVSYSTGRLQWQVGPQVRYQLMSSFISKYPVKENLFDFGLKVGVSLNRQ